MQSNTHPGGQNARSRVKLQIRPEIQMYFLGSSNEQLLKSNHFPVINNDL